MVLTFIAAGSVSELSDPWSEDMSNAHVVTFSEIVGAVFGMVFVFLSETVPATSRISAISE